MKIVAIIMCDEDVYCGGLKTISSLKYFHPEIEIVHYGTSEINRVKQKYGMTDLWFSGPLIIRDYLDNHNAPDILIKIDADCLVLGRLDEVINLNYDFAAPRNDPDSVVGDERNNRPDIIRDIPNHEWVNAGFNAIKNFNFVDKWFNLTMDYMTGKQMALTKYRLYKGDDMSSLNIIFRLGGFDTLILDKKGSNVIYGSSGNGTGETDNDMPESVRENRVANCWRSWKYIYFNGKDCIMPDLGIGVGDRIVKILHQGGGTMKNKLSFDLFGLGFHKYLKEIIGFSK
jgi:hypothetical protein